MFHFKTNIVAFAILCVALALPAAPALASEQSEAGVAAGSAALTLLYAPAKLIYSSLGLVIGGMAYGLSGGDMDVMRAVVSPAVRGDYIVTPAHLRREKSLEFIGRDPESRPQQIVDAQIFEEPY